MTPPIAKAAWRSAPLVCLLLLTGAPATEAERPDPATADSLLAASADTTLPLKQRLSLAEKAIRFDRTGRAAHATARLYMSDWNANAPWNAERCLQRAIEREPENADYRATYAELFWLWERRDDALNRAKEALDLNPGCVLALYWAGRFRVSEMWRFLEAEREGGRISLSRFGEEARDAAIGYLTRALGADPDHRPSRVLLGLVYYEGGMPGELVGLFEDHLKRHPDDRDAHFFAGLGYQAQGGMEKAYLAYVEGLTRMSPPEQAFMKSIFMLTDRKTVEHAGALPDEQTIRRFWAGRDPLLLTPVNERLLEHCRRVAYANLRYGEPLKGIEGWKTDRGQAYIRYGAPLTRSARPAEIATGVELPSRRQAVLARQAARGTVPMSVHNRVEVWSYEGFELVFENLDTRDAWRFRRARVGETSIFELSTLVARLPEYYRDPDRWIRYETPFQVVQFRADGDSTRVEVCYALPEGEVTFKEAGGGVRTVGLTQGLFLFDAAWDTVRKEVGEVGRLPWMTYDKENYLFTGKRLTVRPGTYCLTAETLDRTSRSLGAFRDTLSVRRFSRDSLQVSDLFLARRVVEREDRPPGRDRFSILPNPLARCGWGDQASFYFEVYNLTRDPAGATHYQTTCQVQALPEGEKGETAGWVTAVSYILNGTRAWETHHLDLDLRQVSPGRRTFRLVVTDLLSGQQAVASTTFRVTW